MASTPRLSSRKLASVTSPIDEEIKIRASLLQSVPLGNEIYASSLEQVPEEETSDNFSNAPKRSLRVTSARRLLDLEQLSCSQGASERRDDMRFSGTGSSEAT